MVAWKLQLLLALRSHTFKLLQLSELVASDLAPRYSNNAASPVLKPYFQQAPWVLQTTLPLPLEGSSSAYACSKGLRSCPVRRAVHLVQSAAVKCFTKRLLKQKADWQFPPLTHLALQEAHHVVMIYFSLACRTSLQADCQAACLDCRKRSQPLQTVAVALVIHCSTSCH